MRRLLVLPLVILLLGGVLLSGCGEAGEDSAAVVVAKSGLLGSLGEKLKREDDEAEAAEWAQTTPEERVEAREAAERSEIEAAEPASAIRPAEAVGESS